MVVLASDAAHFWHNIRKRSPFKILHNLEKMIEGWPSCEGSCRRTGSHHPRSAIAVLRRFPKVVGDENAVQLHLPPKD